jgi:hypothetical protein
LEKHNEQARRMGKLGEKDASRKSGISGTICGKTKP